jgi:uncharacterized membrane protein YhhN
MKRVALILFVFLSIIELATQWWTWTSVHNVVKPLLMPALLLWYWLTAGPGQRSVWVLVALVFSCAGDTLLLFQQDARFFIFGLVAFLIGHLFYVFAYRQHQHGVETDALGNVRKLRMAFPVLLAGIGLVVVLYPVLGGMRVPVIVYAAVIQVMVITAIFRWGRTNNPSFLMVLVGALLFMISDSMIAINKFYAPFNQAGFWIMLTYLSGQFLIVRGLLRH